uniref:HAT C-terminal dimerisation domain-containing protein n=1 Tax=Latimeria chalumnae TaxID=7897 RepID=H3AUD8_LATCH
KYRPEWEVMPDLRGWLTPHESDPYKAKCKVYNAVMLVEVLVLKLHSQRNKHCQNMKTCHSLGNNEEHMIQMCEIKLAAFLAENNIPFVAADHLTDVLKNVFDSKIAQNMSLKRTKATSIIRNVVATNHKEELCEMLHSNKFSILMDESTDISSMKTACVVIKKIESKFFELVQVFANPDDASQGATGAKLYDLLVGTLKKHSITDENLIGFIADGVSVMMREHNSVAKNYSGITVMMCVCHSAYLCASEACKVLPRRCEDLARNVYNFFKCSSKRKSSFVQFQVFVDTEIHKILHPSQTRWLSLLAVVKRLLEQWNALKLFFTDAWLSQRLIAVEEIFQWLHDPFMHLYYLFLEWILPKFVTFNQFFQETQVLITELHKKMRLVYTEVLLRYLDRNYVLQTDLEAVNPTRQNKVLPNTQLYLGVNVMMATAKQEIANNPKLLNDFYNNCREFLKESCLQMKKRYKFNDPVLHNLQKLTPKTALSIAERKKFPSIYPLAVVLPRLISSNDDIQTLDDEWRRLPLVAKTLPDNIVNQQEPDIFWGELLHFEDNSGSTEFAHLSKFALLALTTTADCERVFSNINLTKTKTRHRLTTEALNGCL